MCNKERSDAWRKKNAERARENDRLAAQRFRANYPEKARSFQLKALYGIDFEQYQNLLESQNGVCKICSSPPGKKRLHVDHCHTTGAVRGLLCSKCNTALGLFRDDPDLLLRAVEYLDG